MFRKDKKKKKDKVKFKDRPFVKYIKDKAPNLVGNLLDIAGEVTGIEMVEKLGEKIKGIDTEKEESPLTAEEKLHSLELLKAELDNEVALEGEITKRWVADMNSDNVLSKVARPIILFYSWLLVTIVIILEACGIELRSVLIYMIEAGWITVNGGYFVMRTVEKRNTKKYMK